MRMARVILVLASGVAACGPVHQAVPDPTRDLARTESRAPSPPAEVSREPHLGCLDHPRIDVWEKKLRTQRAYQAATARSLERGEEYLPRLREIMAEHGLPEDLALLPAVESGFRPRARGHFGDLGLWQLRSPTARRFGLVVNRKRDDRLSPDESTRAAARYLRALHRRYGDWPLALAAYNGGEGRVDRALRRQPQATFWELAESGKLPRTSREFVPRFFAVVRVSETMTACTQEVAAAERLGADGR
jgi:transglycosylase-like protein with SLT domain